MSAPDGYLRVGPCSVHENCVEAIGGGTGGRLRIELHFRREVAVGIHTQLTALLGPGVAAAHVESVCPHCSNHRDASPAGGSP